jgi:Derlin-2/3
MELTSPLKLYYDEKLIFQRRQYWRIVTNFLYFGQLGLDFMFYLFFLTRYCRMLEEGSFRGRTWDFVWMLLIGAIGMMALTFISLFF